MRSFLIFLAGFAAGGAYMIEGIAPGSSVLILLLLSAALIGLARRA